MSRHLSPIIQAQIDAAIGDRFRELSILERRIGMLSTNNANTLQAIYNHEKLGISAHGIKELILDVINDNLLVNAGLELDEVSPGLPDDWTVVSEIPQGDYTVLLNSDYFKYGERSLKITAVNNLSIPRSISIMQEVSDSIVGGGFYTVGFYCTDNGSEDFRYFVKVHAYTEDHVLLDTFVEYFTNEDTMGVGSVKRALIRHYGVFDMPEDASYCRVHIGIEVDPETSTPVEVWIDYPTFHMGISPLQPNELTEGILKTKHVSTEGMDAKIIKTGIIEITEHLSLSTEAGDVWLKYDETNKGNVLEFYDNNDNRIVALGKYGPNANDYGIDIESNGQWLRANPDGIELSGTIKASAGEIGGFIIDDESIRSSDDEIELNSLLKQIIVRDGANPSVIIGQYQSGKWGAYIGAGSITIGGKFSVDEEGKLTSTSGTIGGISIGSNQLSFPDGTIVLDASTNRISVSNGASNVLVIGEYDDNEFGIDIKHGNINLGDGKFIATSGGEITAIEGTIGNFQMSANNRSLRSLDNSIILDGESSEITLSNDSDYATIFAPGAIYGTAPIAKVSTANFDPEEASASYYMEVTAVKSGATTYVLGVDYFYSKLTGEIVKRKGSDMPNTVTVEYTVYDNRLGDMVITNESESVTFSVVQRATAILTDESLLDVKFVKNLLLGSAEIGHAVIGTAHVDKLHGKVIEVGTLHGDRLIAETLDISKLNFTPLTAASGKSSTDIIATINATQEGIRISGSKIQIDGNVEFSPGYDPTQKTKTFYQAEAPEPGPGVTINEGDIWVDTDDDNTIHFWTGDSWEVGGAHGDFLEKEEYLYPNTTNIDGGKIETNTITLNHLNFAVVHAGNVIASINASTEDGGTLRISGDKIQITGSTTFSNDAPFLDKDTYLAPNKTTIDGGKIETGTIKAAQLDVTDAVITNSTQIKGGIITTTHISTVGLEADVIKSGKLLVGSGGVTIEGSMAVGGNLTITGTIDGNNATLKNLNASEIKTGQLTIDSSNAVSLIKVLGSNSRIEIGPSGLVAHSHRTNNSPQVSIDTSGRLVLGGGRVRGDANGFFAYDSPTGGTAQAGFDTQGRWIAGGAGATQIIADAQGFRAGDVFKIDTVNGEVVVAGKLIALQLFIPVSN